MPKPISFLFENSIFLIAGALVALVWANVDHSMGTHTYQSFVNFEFSEIFDGGHSEHATATTTASQSSEAEGTGDHGSHAFNMAFLINDILMAFFFAIAAKEVWEALLPGGPLSNFKRAATPLFATVGGILGPVAIYLTGTFLTGRWDTLGGGWAVPCATDIAFSYLIARIIFGAKHPAIAFLLLLAIADDAAGLMILALFYPQSPLEGTWLLLTVGAIATAIGMKKLGVRNFWWYLLIPGVMSWLSFFKMGIHPALGLIPIIPCLPHAKTDMGLFAKEERHRKDTLNQFEHWWKNPVEIFLGLFGLANAGVVMSNIGTGTWLVLMGLLVGKPFGITLFTWIGVKAFKLEIPGGMNYRHILTIGTIAGLGFTVALFVSTAAFPVAGPVQDSVKMGALLSFLAALLAFIVARAVGIKRERDDDDLAPGVLPDTSSECVGAEDTIQWEPGHEDEEEVALVTSD